MAPLETVADNIWIAEGEIVNFYGFAYPTRSVVVRLDGDDLWIWSPVLLTPELKSEISGLGAPKHLVSPTKLHHLYLDGWHETYPDARLWGPQSTINKRSELPFSPALEDTPPDEWGGHIDQIWFNGSFAMDEIVFFHHGSRTAILADLSENFSSDFLQKYWAGWKARLASFAGIVEGKGYAPPEWRLSFIRRRDTRRALEKLLAWDPERVIMAHGEWQRKNGRKYLEKAFSWVG